MSMHHFQSNEEVQAAFEERVLNFRDDLEHPWVKCIMLKGSYYKCPKVMATKVASRD